MRIVIVDNNTADRENLAALIRIDKRFYVVKSFGNTFDALNYIKAHTVNIVFSGIDMIDTDGMNGIDFGTQLNTISPNAILVHVTHHKEFALQAFDNYAMGYLMKPVIPNQLMGLLDKFYKIAHTITSDDHTLIVKTLGNFSIQYNNKHIKFRTSKAKELFCLLLHNKNSWVKIDRIIYSLWDNKNPEDAKKLLYTNLSYCRKAFKDIGLNNVIEYKLESYRLNYSNLSWDYNNLQKKLKNISSANVSIEKIMDIIHLDTGMYMADGDYKWAQPSQSYLDLTLHNFYDHQLKNNILSDKEKHRIQSYLDDNMSNLIAKQSI